MRVLSFIFTLIILSFSTVSNGQNTTHIQVTIKGYDQGWAKLIGIYGDQNYIVDSFPVSLQGEIIIQKDTLLHQGLYYLLLPDYKNLSLLIDDEQNITMFTEKGRLISSMIIQNSLCNRLYYESLVIQEKIDSIQAGIKTGISNPASQESLTSYTNQRTKQIENSSSRYPHNFYTLYKLAGQNPSIPEIRKPNGDLDTFVYLQKFRTSFWSNVDFEDTRLLRTPVIGNKLRRFIKELTPQQPDSIIKQADYIIHLSKKSKDMFAFISNWIALQYQPTKTTVMDGEAVFVHIIDTYFDEKTADWFSNEELAKLKKKTSEMRASLLNRKGPNVVSNDPDGNKKSIYEITKPYIIVYMYAPNCEHCKKETPKLKAFYDEWKNQGVEVFAIVLETKHDEWIQYIKSSGIEDWINVYDPTNASIYAKYYVDITPEIYVLNAERMIIGKNLKVEQIPTIIRKDMKKNK